MPEAAEAGALALRAGVAEVAGVARVAGVAGDAPIPAVGLAGVAGMAGTAGVAGVAGVAAFEVPLLAEAASDAAAGGVVCANAPATQMARRAAIS